MAKVVAFVWLLLLAVVRSEETSRTADDFLILAQIAGVSHYQLASGGSYQLPVRNLTNPLAVEYDVKHNCIFWTDSKRVVRQCLTRNEPPEVLVANGIDKVVDLAYDWESETLYYVDAGRHRIEAVETSQRVRRVNTTESNNWRRTVAELGSRTMSTSVAVHPERGLLYWTQYGLGSTQNSSIFSANLDGSNAHRLFWHPNVMRPIDITVDYADERLYWIDYDGNFIATSPVNVNYFSVFAHLNAERKSPNVAISAMNGVVYWSDYDGKVHAVSRANETVPVPDAVVADDFKVYSKQQNQFNECGKGRHNCTHICVGAPPKSFTCLCPDALIARNSRCECPGGEEQDCYARLYGCKPSEFACTADHKCVTLFRRCDGNADCLDGSDEQECPSETTEGPSYSRYIILMLAILAIIVIILSIYHFWNKWRRTESAANNL